MFVVDEIDISGIMNHPKILEIELGIPALHDTPEKNP
jgi:hypothetical protein